MQNPQAINRAGKPPRRARKFNGTFILIFLIIITVIAFIATVIVSQLRWNSLLVKVEPQENWTQIGKDLKNYWKKNHKLPETLNEGEKLGWKWAVEPVINYQAGALANGQIRNVSRVKFKQYV